MHVCVHYICNRRFGMLLLSTLRTVSTSIVKIFFIEEEK